MTTSGGWSLSREGQWVAEDRAVDGDDLRARQWVSLCVAGRAHETVQSAELGLESKEEARHTAFAAVLARLDGAITKKGEEQNDDGHGIDCARASRRQFTA
jgi:hypothetical protein